MELCRRNLFGNDKEGNGRDSQSHHYNYNFDSAYRHRVPPQGNKNDKQI
jgi:hypothetical protein